MTEKTKVFYFLFYQCPSPSHMPLNGHSYLVVSRTWHDNTKEKAGKPSRDLHCWTRRVHFRLNDLFPDLGRLFLALIQPMLPSNYWSTIRIPPKATMLIKPYPSQYGVFIKLNYFRYVTQLIYLVIMLISINFNCIREAHDWEVNFLLLSSKCCIQL